METERQLAATIMKQKLQYFGHVIKVQNLCTSRTGDKGEDQGITGLMRLEIGQREHWQSAWSW